MKKLSKAPDLCATVKSSLFQAILTGELLPGEKLQQEKLAEQLGVSRQPVSHALKILEQQGILIAYDSRSLTVAEPKLEEMLQMVDIRKVLDSYAAFKAAEKFASQKPGVQDSRIVDKIMTLVERNLDAKQSDAKRGALDDIEFHKLIRNLSGNPLVQETLEPHVLHHSRLIYIISQEMDPRIWIEHKRILDAILDGNAELASQSMAEHISEGAAKLPKLLGQELAAA